MKHIQKFDNSFKCIIIILILILILYNSKQFLYNYKYDKYNNWTEKVIYKGDTPKVIVERELVYF